MKKKLLVAMVALATMSGMLFAQGSSEKSTYSKKPIELVYTMTAVPTDAHAGAMKVFKEVVEKESNGQIKVLTYDSASLFKQDQELAAIKSGQADITATLLLCKFSGHFILYMKTFFDSESATKMFDKIASEQGIRPLGAKYLGPRQLDMVDDIDIKTPAYLKGVNLRVSNSDLWIFF